MFEVLRDVADPTKLDIFTNDPSHLNPQRVSLVALAALTIDGRLGDDTVILNFANGPLAAPGDATAPRFLIGRSTDQYGNPNPADLLGVNRVRIIGAALNETVRSDSATNQQTLTLGTTGGGIVNTEATLFAQRISSEAGGTATVQADDQPHAITYSNGSTTDRGLITIDSASYEFKNKARVSVVGGAGVDSIEVANPYTPAGLTRIDFDAGGPAAGQLLAAKGIAATTTVDVAAHTLAGVSGAGGAVLVGFAGVDQLFFTAAASSTLAVRGSANVAVTRGQTSDAGTVSSGGLAIRYSGLGSGKTLRVTGSSSAAQLRVDGGPGNDVFTVAAGTGDVAISGRASIKTSSIAALSLNGLAGDDLFNLPLSGAPYATINTTGGANASIAGDRLNLTATSANDTIGLSGGTFKLGAKTVAAAEMEDVRLDSGDGADLLTYTATAGRKDDVAITASGAANGGRLGVSLLGVAVSFTNTEQLKVTGGSSSEGDSLLFTATTASDLLKVNYAAAGTASTPFLTLLNTAATSTLLKLLGIGGFSTLNLKTLDGNDTVKVSTTRTPGAGAGAVRKIVFQGGTGTNVLDVQYTGSGTSASKNATTRTVIVDYKTGTSKYTVEYVDVATVKLTKV